MLKIYCQLLRLNNPTGILLLLFPVLWAIALINQGDLFKDKKLLLIFVLASVLMRSAGCIINDLIDIDLDKKVHRTKGRPLASGAISIKRALLILSILLLLSLLLLLQLNIFAIKLGVFAIVPIIIYPLMKRYTYWPQLFLSLTFNFGVLIAFAAFTNQISRIAICLYLASIFWTLAYDTIYAYQDRQDDALIGIKSTALKFGEEGEKFLRYFFQCFLAFIFIVANLYNLSFDFYPCFALAVVHVSWQLYSFKYQDVTRCMLLFKSNSLLGLIVLFALMMG
jgi:4-hydroxybenzoate polyprenyltransferase